MADAKTPELDQTLRVQGGATPPSAHPRQREVPARLGRYEVRALLGSGGMGSVYLAYDTQLDRQVALKVPHHPSDDDPDLLDRFGAEAQAAAGINHPNLCTVHDVGEVDGVPYLTMNYVSGRPLTDMLVTGEPLAQEHAALIAQQVAAAMDLAHRANIVHRDLKPANIMLGEHGTPVVMDFGVARRESAARRRLTHQGTSLGTPGYMAPEALRGDAMGPPCDIYSLGVTLYQLLTGRLPFTGGPVETVRQVLRGDRARPLAELRAGVDPQLAAICQRAMAGRIEERFATMGELAEALMEFLRGRSRQFQVGDEAEPAELSRAEVLSRAGHELFLLGRWEVAYNVIATAAGLPGLDTRAAIRQRNRLVNLCKSMDTWTVGLGHSDWCVAHLQPEDPPELQARVGVNRGSTLYDLGRRAEAGVVLEAAHQHATKCRTPILRAAALNNLGVFHHYGDRLARAEEVLRQGLADAGGLETAYLLTNLGLLQLTRSLADAVEAEAAAVTLQSALVRFTEGGHLQGISYALSNRALCDLHAGRLAEARDAFEETIRIGERLGEKWTVYGARANLALVALAWGNPALAAELATDAAARAADNQDPKGVADANLIAARALIDGAGPRQAADELLAATAEKFGELEQRLGQALAWIGRTELGGDHEARARALLSQTELPGLPVKFVAPPFHMLFLLELF